MSEEDWSLHCTDCPFNDTCKGIPDEYALCRHLEEEKLNP